MINIPNQAKYTRTGTSDLFGNIWYTKNMNFDEEGYAKLSSRCISFKSEEDDSDFNLPLSFGRAQGEFHIVTADKAYDVSVLDSNFSIAEDNNSNAPSLTFDSWGKWFNNKWHASTATKIWYTTGGSWTDTSVSITSGKVHALEVHRGNNQLCVSNGNTVLALDTSYVTQATLTIPADFEIIALSYSNARMGVATMLSDSAAGQNQEAYFFVWDGVSAGAGQSYPMGSDTIMGIKAYKSSWIILTRTGELKYFNGGGFETLYTFPFYFKNTTWGDSQNRETLGDIMEVDGDVIYINIGNEIDAFNERGETFLQNHLGGIICYDPKVGAYHRYSPSISPGSQVSVLSANVNTTTDIITASSGTLATTGNPIKYVDDFSNQIGGLNVGTIYYIIRHTSTTFSLAETKEDALAGNKINLTAANDAKFLSLNVLDYGTVKCGRSGGLGVMETRKEICDHLLMGATLFDYNSLNDYEMLSLTVPGFENRGYFVTSKVLSSEVQDIHQKVYVKYRPLKYGDKIIVKYKDKDILGIPATNMRYQFSSSVYSCTWTSASTLTTTTPITEVESYINDNNGECEVEILSGAGGGQMAQIESIVEDGGTYTITLAEDIDGAANGYFCDIIIDNWHKLGEITTDDTKGFKEFPVSKNSDWFKYKIELRGNETTIEEFKIINKIHLPA